MNPSRWFFSPRTWIYRVGVEVGGAPGGAPHPREQGMAPLALILSPIFFINSKNILREVSGHSENFYFCTKITPWQFCWKQCQSGLVLFKCKLESKTRAKVFGKVDTMETYQHAQLSGLLPYILTCMHIVIPIRLSHVVDLMTYIFFLLSRSCARAHTHIPCIHVYLSHMHIQGVLCLHM